MNIIGLKEAVQEIARTSRRAADWGDVEPYVFVVGAGISHPSVLLATDIQKHCEQEAGRLGPVEQPQKSSAVDQYTYWFMKAYPNAVEQQRYLQSLIEHKPITAASFRLAHLLIQGDVGKILITPNFDDFIARALGIFGHAEVRLCDHPETVERVGPEETEVQVIHVHGSYRYYDLANLRPQIELRAEVSTSTSFTMLGLLDRILINRSPIVVGYSGWSGDVIMTALERRLERRRLKYRMFWFCYQRGSLDSLPPWLREHNDVVFVVPAEVDRLRSSAGEDKGALRDLLVADPKGGASASTLAAQDIFEGLIRELALKAPDLVTDPLAFFARQLKQAISSSEVANSGSQDPYSLMSVVDRIHLARRRQISETREIEQQLERVRDAIRRSLYIQAVKHARDLRFDALDHARLTEITKLLMLAMQNLESDPLEQREASEIIISICKPLPDELKNQEWVTLWVTAHYELGLALSKIGAKKESIVAYEEVSKAEAKDIAPEQAWRRVWALRSKAYIMQDVGRKEEALSAFDEAIAAGLGSRGARSLEAVARALADKGAVLRELEKYDEALAVFGQLLSQFGDSQNAAIQSMLGYASVARADLLEFSGKLEAANVERESLVSKFIDAGVPRVAVWVGWALCDKGTTLHKLGRNEEARECFDRAILYCSTELPSQPVTGYVLRGKAQLMVDQGNTDAALEIYRDVVNRFGDSVNPDLQLHVAWALENQAAILEKSLRAEDARAAYESIIRRFPAPTGEHLTAVVTRASAKIEALKQQAT